MDVLGDIAGVYEFLIQIFGIVLFRISSHSFTVNAIKKLFYVQIKNKHIFKKNTKKDAHSCGIKKYVSNDIKKSLCHPNSIHKCGIEEQIDIHRYASLTLKSNIKLFFINLWNDYVKESLKIENKLTKFFEKGQDKVEECFNVVKLLKDIKFLKVFNTVKHNIDLKTKF